MGERGVGSLPVEELTEAEAGAELARLAQAIGGEPGLSRRGCARDHRRGL
jgi:hypothetical protein